jgi:hypothetical protein
LGLHAPHAVPPADGLYCVYRRAGMALRINSSEITLFGIALALSTLVGFASSYPASATEIGKISVNETGAASATAAGLDNFWKLYRAKDYAGAASLFESLITSARPGANAYYYAALANQQVYKQSRAKQLFNYIISAFPGSVEATYAKKSLGLPTGSEGAAKPKGDDDLPESVKSKLSPEMQEMLKTPAGKKVVAQTLKDQADSIKTIKDAEKKGVLSTDNAIAPSATTKVAVAKTTVSTRRVGDHPFSPEQIAREGTDGIDQTNAPNCWFESAMSALAQLPRGQKAISQMITYGEGNSYMVRFPGDGVEYKITKDDLEDSGVKNTALWASLLDYAERKKFPNNVGASGPDDDKHRLQVGLGCITGCNAEMIFPRQASKQAISSFIYGAVSSHNPVTCGSAGRDRSIPAPVIEGHAYTIIGFEPSRNMVTLRNPHGRKARRFSVPGDPGHLQFEQLDDGVCKMNLDLFCDAFGSVCRSFM